ncbi:MAG: response regulator receiver protein, partial [Methylobacterium sp.]|nr:response regulator receiver protein [Methylobacterium sp.]
INLAHQAGADAFILKPFDMSVLKAKLKQVINRKPRRREAPLASESALSIEFPMLGKF